MCFFAGRGSITGFPGGAIGRVLPVLGDARDTSSISGLGRTPEKEMATHSSILAWRIPWSEPWLATALGVTKSQT